MPATSPMEPGDVITIVGPASANDGSTWTPPDPTVTDIEVPSDGTHLEVAAGVCVLKDVPATAPEFHFSAGDVKINCTNR